MLQSLSEISDILKIQTSVPLIHDEILERCHDILQIDSFTSHKEADMCLRTKKISPLRRSVFVLYKDSVRTAL
jgi:hypothetical protein